MKQVIYKGYIINPTTELSADYKISPFSNKFQFEERNSIDKSRLLTLYSYLKDRFDNYCFTEKGRTAIAKALSFYDLHKDDVVTILTTSGNLYISGCVTKEIEKYCSWSREFTSKTKIIFVNHEFGYPYEDLFELKKYGLPIIEDCAHTFFSKDKNQNIGKVGDFVIYSLPKAFPMQMGGILVSNKYDLRKEELSQESLNYIEYNLSINFNRIDEIIKKRIDNHNQLAYRLAELSIKPFFKLNKNIIPGVFLFKWDVDINYSELKVFMQNNGVESSVFYGQNAFYIPIHELLTEKSLDYFSALLEFYYNNYKKV